MLTRRLQLRVLHNQNFIHIFAFNYSRGISRVDSMDPTHGFLSKNSHLTILFNSDRLKVANLRDTYGI